jgi:hypothetical protein
MMKNLDYYLTIDHAARTRTMVLSVAGGAMAGMFSESIGAAQIVAVVICFVVVGVLEIGGLWRYKRPVEKRLHRSTTVHSPARRSLILLPVSAVFFLVFALAPTSRVEAAVIEDRLKRNARNPYDPENAKDTERIIENAGAEKIKISPAVLASVGQRFIQSAPSNPSARDAAVAIGNYRTLLTVDPRPELKRSYVPYYQAKNRNPDSWPNVLAVGEAPADQSAIYNKIGRYPVQGSAVGPAFFTAEGDEEALDGMHFKNVVFRNVRIVYLGGPTILENVYFVNCEFGVSRINPTYTPNFFELLRQVLKSPSVNFTAF